VRVREEGMAGYLTGIVKSGLEWIEGEEERERVWGEASLRLCERAGRTGRWSMGDLRWLFSVLLTGTDKYLIARPPLTRTFTVPHPPSSSIAITLHEPTLTSDDLGLKTWASSYLLARRLHSLAHHLSPLTNVLELGAGTGLLGIAAAAILRSTVHLTDLPAIVPNLERNIAANVVMIAEHGGFATAGVLDWSDDGPTPSSEENAKYNLVLAADPLYSPTHPQLLVQTISRWLRRPGVEGGDGSRVIVELPLREAYRPEIAEFRARMERVGLGIREEGEESGRDDWGGGGEVRCWWGVWGWVKGEGGG
jgi:predicted nicotinamide N-methyase